MRPVDKNFNIIGPEDTLYSIDQLLDWINDAPGEFHISALARNTTYQQHYTEKLETLVKTGLLEHANKKRGWYRPVDSELEEMDYINAIDEPVDIWLPFELSDKVEIYEGNIIIIAGVINTGKTSLALNIINENKRKFDISYFNSEMGAGELKRRLKLFPYVGLDDWDFKAYSRTEKFADVIKSGPNQLNIIDFLEVHDEFYMVGRLIKEIHDKLKGGIAIICLQKNPGQDTGLGGYRSMEVARLVLALDYGRIKITKAKNYRGEENPNGLIKNFKLLHGSQIIDRNKWFRDGEEKTNG